SGQAGPGSLSGLVGRKPARAGWSVLTQDHGGRGLPLLSTVGDGPAQRVPRGLRRGARRLAAGAQTGGAGGAGHPAALRPRVLRLCPALAPSALGSGPELESLPPAYRHRLSPAAALSVADRGSAPGGGAARGILLPRLHAAAPRGPVWGRAAGAGHSRRTRVSPHPDPVRPRASRGALSLAAGGLLSGADLRLVAQAHRHLAGRGALPRRLQPDGPGVGSEHPGPALESRRMTVREQLEREEDRRLHPRAAHSATTRGRERPLPPDDLRPDYQRDRDRILHSKAFRRLKGKTQVFLAPVGDHYRTRLTHTLEVAQVARTIALALRLNEPLVEAMSLGHDLGHTPFGHAGERVLDDIVSG